MSTRWRYYNSRGGNNRFRGRGRGRGKGRSLTAYQLPQDNIDINNYFRDTAMNPNDCVDKTVLSLSFGQNMLGAAYYEQSSQLLKIMNDISEDHEFKYLERLIEEVKPTMILVNKSQDLVFIKWLSARYEDVDRLKRGDDSKDVTTESAPTWNPALAYDDYEETEETDNEEDFDGPKAQLYKLPNNFSKMPRALERLKKMLETNEVSISDEDKRVFVSMRFNFDAVHTIRALGALLLFLDETRLGVEKEPLSVSPPIKSIKTVTLANLVDIDFNTIQALDILPKETESKRVAGQKRSLYALADGCRSSVGKKCLRKWFRNPTTDRDELISRQKCVYFFKQDWNADITAKVSQLLGKCKPQNNIFLRFQTGSAQLLHWEGFISTVNALVEVMNIIKQTPIAGELYVENSLISDVSEIAIITGSIINFTESKLQGRVTVMPGIDGELDELRETYTQMPLVLTAVAKQEAARLGIIQTSQVSCLYVPLVGFILALPRDFSPDGHPDMTLVYATSEELRVRNATTERLEEQYGDILMRLIDKQTVIILKLKSRVMKRKRSINKLLSIAARIDALVSLGITAAENGWNCPTLVDEPVIEAAELFHPISALVVKKNAVPNPVCSGRNGMKVSVITGPNACGKSVYMKSIGILVFLTHIGSFVPARHAKVGMVDRIVTRMFTVDSVLDGMSTFAKDVEQVALALRKATARSLVIIDEFGKGTMTEVGLSLLASCMNHWMAKGIEACPHIFLASHFHALPRYLPTDNNLVSYLTFRVLREPGGKVRYLFQLVPGMVDCSFALSVAKEEGIPISILGRASRIYKALKSGTPLREVRAEVANEDEEQLISDMDSILSQEQGFLDELERIVLREKETAAEEVVEEERSEERESGSGAVVGMENEVQTPRSASTGSTSREKRQRPISASTILSRTTVTDKLSLFDALLPVRKKPKHSEPQPASEEKESSMPTAPSPDPFNDDDEEDVTPTRLVPLLQRLSSGDERSSSQIAETLVQKKSEDVGRNGIKRPPSLSFLDSNRKRILSSLPEGNMFETPKQPSRNSCTRFAPSQSSRKSQGESQFKTPMNFKNPRIPQCSSSSKSHQPSGISASNQPRSSSSKSRAPSDPYAYQNTPQESGQSQRFIESQRSEECDLDLTRRSSSRRATRTEESQFQFRGSPVLASPDRSQFSFLNSQKSSMLDPSDFDKYSFGTQERAGSSRKSAEKVTNPYDFIFETPAPSSRSSKKQRSFFLEKSQKSGQTISPSSVILGELSRAVTTPLQTPLPMRDRIDDDDDYDPLFGSKSEMQRSFQKSDDEDEEFLKSFFESEKSLKIASSSDSSMNKSSKK